MITAAHLIHEIRTIASSSSNSDDFKASDELILHWCNQVRAKLISQALDKRSDISDTWIQHITCFELEQVDASDCCEVETDCIILRSVKELPATVEASGRNTIIGVYTVGGEVIDEINLQKVRYTKYNKYSSKRRGWYIKNDRLYIINDNILEKVTVSGIWDDPSELGNYISCDNEACWSINSNYPVSMKMVESIVDIVLKTKCQPMLTFPYDNTNDASDATPQQIQQSKAE